MRLFLLLQAVAALNILITSTDSWVSKNPRFLYASLKEKGHNVKYIGPVSTEQPPIDNGQKVKTFSEFHHMSSANQKYLRTLRKLNTLAKGPKHIITRADSKKFDIEFESQNIVKQSSFGQDPLNPDFWFVNASPLEALSFGLDTIIPEHMPDFVPDIVVVGPNDGLHLSPMTSRQPKITFVDLSWAANQVNAMTQLLQVKNVRVIAVSVEDHDSIYYCDEEYFNAEPSSYRRSFKRNHVSKNVRFVNSRVVSLIERVGVQLPERVALNINFPSLNHRDSSCTTKGRHGPAFNQVVRSGAKSAAIGKVVLVPEYQIEDKAVTRSGEKYLRISEGVESEELAEIELARLRDSMIITDSKDMDMVDGNPSELDTLSKCAISVAVNHLTEGNNLGADVFNAAMYF